MRWNSKSAGRGFSYVALDGEGAEMPYVVSPFDDLDEDADSEPSLGSVSGHGDQRFWAQGRDDEWNGDETDWSDNSSGMDGGIGDIGGLCEQTTRFY